MENHSSLKAKIVSLKALVEKDSISPTLLGNLLLEMVDTFAYNSSDEFLRTLMPTITFDDLDTMGYADTMALLEAAFDKPLMPTRYAVMGPGSDATAKVVGILDVFAASNVAGGVCTVTQVLTTNIVFNPQTGKFDNAHNDTSVYRYARQLRTGGTDSIGVGIGEWTGWWYDDATAARRAHDHIFQPESPRGHERYGVITVPTEENEDKTEAVRIEPYADVADIRFHFSTTAGGGAHRVRIPEAHVSSDNEDSHVSGLFGANAYNATVAAGAAKAAENLRIHNFGTISLPLDKVSKFVDTAISGVLSRPDTLNVSKMLDSVDAGWNVTGSFSVYHHPTTTKFDVMNLETGSVNLNGGSGREYKFRCLYYDATNDNVRLCIARIVFKRLSSTGATYIAPVVIRQLDLPLKADLNIDLTRLATKEYADLAAKQTFIDLWKSASGGLGDYNEATDRFELNGLTDISWAEARLIYAHRQSYPNPAPIDINGVRTNLLIPSFLGECYQDVRLTRMFRGNGLKTVRVAASNEWCCPSDINRMICATSSNSNIAEMIGEIDCRRIVTPEISPMLEGFMYLNFKTLLLRNLSHDLDMRWCPALSAASVRFWVENAAFPRYKKITITVHQDVFNKLNGIWGVSADALPAEAAEWDGILASAALKDISFARP